MTDIYATGITEDLQSPPAIPWDNGARPLHPTTAFEWLERGWRPALGAICGAALAYNFILAPVTERREVDEGKLWIIATVGLGLAGVRTIERVGPQMVRRA